jgi:hypothetical protein
VKLRFNADKIAEISDAREMPAYSIPQAAHYLQMPVATLRSWVRGRDYPTGGGKKRFKPLIRLPVEERPLLSFFNLVEAHVLSALRRGHSIRLHDIRTSLNYIQNELGAAHPLLDYRFQTDGIALFVRKLGKLVDVSAAGQMVMREVLEAYLKRLEREDLVVARLYPFTRARETDFHRSAALLRPAGTGPCPHRHRRHRRTVQGGRIHRRPGGRLCLRAARNRGGAPLRALARSRLNLESFSSTSASAARFSRALFARRGNKSNCSPTISSPTRGFASHAMNSGRPGLVEAWAMQPGNTDKSSGRNRRP